MRRRKIMELKKIEIVDAYKEYLEEHKSYNTSESTIATYKIHIDSFLDFCECDKFKIIFAMLDKDFWIYYIQELQEDEKKSDITVKSYCRSVRAFLYWAMDNNYMQSEALKLPKCEEAIKETYTQEEVSNLIEKPNKECSEVIYQTWVFVNLIMSTGLRLSSALNIKVSNYVKAEHLLYIQKTKQKKGQQLYINDEVCNILNKYIRQFDLEEEDYLFCTGNKTQMAKRTMQDNVASYNKSHRIDKTSIHLMRHTFAKNYYIKTHDIYNLQMILGHSSISTTEKYIRSLGLTITASTVYNPQRQFLGGNITKNTRRKKRCK